MFSWHYHFILFYFAKVGTTIKPFNETKNEKLSGPQLVASLDNLGLENTVYMHPWTVNMHAWSSSYRTEMPRFVHTVFCSVSTYVVVL